MGSGNRFDPQDRRNEDILTAIDRAATIVAEAITAGFASLAAFRIDRPPESEIGKFEPDPTFHETAFPPNPAPTGTLSSVSLTSATLSAGNASAGSPAPTIPSPFAPPPEPASILAAPASTFGEGPHYSVLDRGFPKADPVRTP
jgi:hypothetical protein